MLVPLTGIHIALLAPPRAAEVVLTPVVYHALRLHPGPAEPVLGYAGFLRIRRSLYCRQA